MKLNNSIVPKARIKCDFQIAILEICSRVIEKYSFPYGMFLLWLYKRNNFLAIVNITWVSDSFQVSAVLQVVAKWRGPDQETKQIWHAQKTPIDDTTTADDSLIEFQHTAVTWPIH